MRQTKRSAKGRRVKEVVPVLGAVVGSLSLAGNLYVGTFASSSGKIAQTGGAASSKSLLIGSNAGSTGEYVQSGGTLTLTQAVTVGDSGSGKFFLSGGATLSPGGGTQPLRIARLAGSSGLVQIGSNGVAGTLNASAIEFGGLMTKIKGTNPDIVYFGGTTQSKGGLIAKDMVKAALTCPMLAPDGCYEQAFIDSAGADNLNDRCYVTIFGLDPSQLEGKGAEFVKKYKEKYKTDPEAFALYGYECAKVFLEALKAVGKKDREELRKAVLADDNFSVFAVTFVGDRRRLVRPTAGGGSNQDANGQRKNSTLLHGTPPVRMHHYRARQRCLM